MIDRYTTLSRSLFTLSLLVLILTGCDSTDPEDSGPLETLRVEDVPADVSTSVGGERPSSTGRYTLVDLQDGGEIVLSSSEEDRSDSTSTEWDIGFQQTNIIFNSGESGPGQGGGLILEELFGDVTEAPASGYSATLGTWYNYSGPPTHIATPIPGRTIVVRTADGEHYAKLRILSYYEGAPAEPSSDDDSRYYTFEYVLQEDGSRQFE